MNYHERIMSLNTFETAMLKGTSEEYQQGYVAGQTDAAEIAAEADARIAELEGQLDSAKCTVAVKEESCKELEQQVKELSEWRPIESAPKDGTWIFAVFGGHWTSCYWDNDLCKPSWNGADDFITHYEPDSWYPLPTGGEG